jgi:hypothetical protein
MATPQKPNRVNDADGPRGEIFGSSLAHAELNVLARLPRLRQALGEGAMVDLVRELERGGEVTLLTAMEVDAALGHLWPRLHQLCQQL